MIVGSLDHKSKYIVIMDDLLIHSTKKDHWILGRFHKSHDKKWPQSESKEMPVI